MSRSAFSPRRPSATACWRRSSSRSRTTRSARGRGSSPASRRWCFIPNLQDKEAGYVQAFVDLLPTPWRGFMLAGFAAAYMSTVGHAAQLGRVVPGQRLLQAVPEEERDRAALRHGLAPGDDLPLLRVDAGHLAAQLGGAGVEAAAGVRRRDGPGAHPALVLVADQRVVRDQRDDLSRSSWRSSPAQRFRSASPRATRTPMR